MELSKTIKRLLVSLAATTFLASASLVYAGDADVYGNVTQVITLDEINLDSTGGEVNAFVGSLKAFDGSAVAGEMDVTITAKAIDMDTLTGKALLSVGGTEAGQTSNE